MQPPDFLHKDASTPLCEQYVVAGARCSLSTNSEELLCAARGSFARVSLPPDRLDFSLRFWVDKGQRSRPPWPKPYVRGLDHLVFAGFDADSSLLADLRTRRVIGRFSPAMAADIAHWRMTVFPILLSILAGSIGAVELHASSVAMDQHALLLLGASRSGKSTLAMALTQAGFRLISDDRTFCSVSFEAHDQLLAWGLPRPLKLRPEAARWFEDYRDREPNGVQNGELVFHCEPNLEATQGQQSLCQPRMLVFLERQDDSGFSLTRIRKGEARSRIERDLLAESSKAVQVQSEVLHQLLSVPCQILRYGGTPKAIAAQLAESLLHTIEYSSQGGAA